MWEKIKNYLKSLFFMEEEVEPAEEKQSSVNNYEKAKNRGIVNELYGDTISIYELRSGEEVEEIANWLVKNRVVIVNYRKMSETVIHDIKTFLKGVMYSRGCIVNISDEVVVYAPDNRDDTNNTEDSGPEILKHIFIN